MHFRQIRPHACVMGLKVVECYHRMKRSELLVRQARIEMPLATRIQQFIALQYPATPALA
jgi:hypothetical protein